MKQGTIKTSYETLPLKLIDAICYYLALYPRMTHGEISKKVARDLVNIQPTAELVAYVAEQEAERIDELSLGGIEAVKVGIMLRNLPLATLHGRVELLHEIIDMGKNGYMAESMSPRGEITELKVRDFRSALDATKQLSTLMEVIESASQEEDDTIYVDVYEHLKTQS